MRFDTFVNWSSSFLPPVLITWVGAGMGTLLNPFTANPVCRTVSKISPIIPCTTGAVALVVHLWNANLQRNFKRLRANEPTLTLSAHETVCKKVWKWTHNASYLASGLAIGTSAMEISELIFFCTASTNNLPTIAIAVQVPLLAIAVWNSLTVQQINTPAPPAPTIELVQIPSDTSISIVDPTDVEEWK